MFLQALLGVICIMFQSTTLLHFPHFHSIPFSSLILFYPILSYPILSSPHFLSLPPISPLHPLLLLSAPTFSFSLLPSPFCHCTTYYLTYSLTFSHTPCYPLLPPHTTSLLTTQLTPSWTSMS